MYKWSNGTELYHHGIKGQKWGIRRFQNADGTYTEEGKRRRQAEFYREVAKDAAHQTKTNKTWRDAVYDNASVGIQKELTGIVNDKRYIDAKAKLDSAGKLGAEYFNNRDLMRKYSTLAAIVEYLDWGGDKTLKSDSDVEYLHQLMHGYLYEDLDQGTFESFNIFALDRGVDPEKYNDAVLKAEKEYNDTVSSMIQDILGPYSKMPVQRKYTIDRNAEAYVSDLLENREDTFASTYLIDHAGIKEADLKKLIEEAKKIFPQVDGAIV